MSTQILEGGTQGIETGKGSGRGMPDIFKSRGTVKLLATLIISIILSASSFLYAAEPGVGKDVQEKLRQSKATIDKALAVINAGGSATDESYQLKALAMELKAGHLLLQKKFRLRREDIKGKGAKAEERHRAMEEGYQKALGDYLNLIESLDPLAPVNQQTLESLRVLLEQILPKRKRPLFGSLPYRNLNYPSREPASLPPIRPAYKGGNKVVSPNDTKDTPEAPLSLELATLAQSLKWNPVLIYEYVMNNIETEWYWGCMKGAEKTLRQRSGNDCDQATLLTALLRVSGFPTRYVRGTVEFFAGGRRVDMDKVRNLFGIDDPAGIAAYLQKAGIPYRPVIAGGRIANFQVEHIWVETQVPYGNYRGAIIDDSDKTWLGLDTSIKIKDYIYNSPLDIYQQSALGSELAGIKEEYLGTSRTQTPLEYLKSKILTSSGQSAENYKSSRALPAFILKILPSSMQFDQKLITHEYTEIPDELKHKVRFIATAVGTQGVLFDITLDALRISNQRIVITYEPETVEDQEIIDSYGGLDNTPAYLIRLRPVLELNDERIVVGRDGLPMGADHDLSLELISPNGIEKIKSSHITGNVSAIGIVSQKAVLSSPPLLAGEGDKDAKQILYEEAIHYIDRWNQAEEELASFLHLNITRPIPTVVTTGGVIDVTYLLDMPHGFQWKGMFIDANLRAISVQPSAGAQLMTPSFEQQKTFMQLSGLHGSVLEHRIFEDDLGIDSISTAKLFQIAGAYGGTPSLITIDKTNVTTVLPPLPFDTGVKEDITSAVNQNLTVKIPSAEITYEDWSGIGYIKQNPDTGESGYMLSGMLAGGMTAVFPYKWSSLADILGKPYDSDYNSLVITDPKNESMVTTGTIRVTGTVLDAHASVVVNGIEATVSGNAFTAGGIILTRGMNTITATATNYNGKIISTKIRVLYKIPIKTAITFPFDGSDLSGPSVDVEGLVSDNLTVVEVNGVTAEVSADGRFVAKGVALNPGTNQITATARNAEGETDLFAINVNGLTSTAGPISITITSPQGKAVINRPSVMVTGTVVTTAEEISVKVNGVLAEVSEGRFVANHVPLAEGNNTIVVNAVDTNGSVARAEVSVRSVKGPYVTLTANITSGIPTLGAYFRISTEIPNPAISYKMDFEGDGVTDYTGAVFDDITHDYITEGIYHPTIAVTDDQGNVYTDTIAVIVLNRAKIDALLKGKWEKMKGALVRGDIEGAVNYFEDSSKEKYRRIFNILKNNLSSVTSDMRAIEMDYVQAGIAEYRIGRFEDVSGQSRDITYFIYFEKDEHGLWRIVSF